MKKSKFPIHYQILLALLLGILFGYFLPAQVKYISWMGDIFIRALKMIIIPLILSSVISGVAGMGSAGDLGRLGLKTIGYYMFTSLIAILTGLALVNLIQPGTGVDLGLMQQTDELGLGSKSFRELLLEIIPVNIFETLVQGNMLSIIFFAVLSGFFINYTSEKSRKTLTAFFESFFELMMKITLFVIRFAPFGVFGIVALQVSRSADLAGLAGSMGRYMLTVIFGLLIHACISLPVMLRLMARIHPLRHYRAVSSALMTAFSTSSSSATLPLTIESVENNCRVSNKISSFTLPLGATINMDGTALYECVAAMFIAQAYGIELSFLQQMIVVFTALLASIGAAGIPMAGLVMISIVLSAVGLPLEGVGLILAVDRILDMFRTSVNVLSDTCGAVIIARSEGEKIFL
ncbi:MAG TPA: dicarboxylate/amino acid:cation symporter [Bacteroidales bacterium]|nr:dicarboxylate/amino acid:cation symporter [Bacteroidales bacterium]HSA44805.1 dicarboxylate/amino acid:cation symporter [Bacteroidales bacterium]